MVFQGVFMSSWIGFLLLHIAACVPLQQGQMDVGHFYGSRGSRRGGPGSGSGAAADLGFGKVPSSTFGPFSGVGADAGSSPAQDDSISTMIANLLRMGPSNNGFQQSLQASAFQLPLSVIAPRPLYPYSYVIHTSNGYKRARNDQFNSKYVQDTFDDQPGTPQNPGSGSKGDQKV